MQTPLVGRLLLLAALVVAAPSLRAQEEGHSLRETQVKEILQSCKGATIPQIWQHADELASLGQAAKRIIQNEVSGAGVEGRLAGLSALIKLDSPTFAAGKLMDIAADEAAGIDYRLAALELVGQTEETDVEDGLTELLVSYNPQLRIGAARALWALDGRQKQRAKDTLREFLKSSDPDLRAQGALALGEMGDSETPEVLAILRDLSREPGLRGKYAGALYSNLNYQRTIQMREAEDEAGAAQNRGSGLWRHLDEIHQYIKDAYDLADEANDETLRVGAAKGMLNFPDDPHTMFFSPEEYREFLHGSDGVDPSYGGIGAFIDTNVKDSFRILRPIFGGPAWKADIQGGDDIIAVNGQPTLGRSTTDIIKDIKGQPGTEVILTIYREGWAEPKDVKVIRARIILPTVFSRMLPGKVGYLQIAQFSSDTGKEMMDHLLALEADGMRGLVLDLRDNPGGLLQSVQDCLTAFLKSRELVCTAKGRIGYHRKYYAGSPDKERRYPISVLVSGRSASGAELMSGVLQYYSKSSQIGTAEDPYVDAVVMGSTTFGKGSMQSTFPLHTWPGEKFVDEARKNGLYDPGEKFTDTNGNRRWDPGEPFEDLARKNERWDDAEVWEDLNGNGHWDPGEKFEDANGDGIWNPREDFTDANGNGEYDYGAAVKMSVARYYLPGGTNFTRKRVFDENEQKYKTEGGVVPDIAIEQERMDIANLVELRDLQTKGVFDQYVKERWDANQDAFRELAMFDGRDPARYPGFDEFYKGLRTRLTEQEVRRGLRLAVRRRVEVEQGKEILGDLSDDNVLLRGAHEVLRRLGEDPESIPEYRSLEQTATTR